VADDVHSTYEMVKGLHARFDGFEHRIDKIETRVGSLEKGLAADVAHLEKHESEASLKGAAMLEKLTSLVDNFKRHADREENDRRWLLTIVIGTLLSSTGSLLYMVLTGVGS
jgi:hypothetical protein